MSETPTPSCRDPFEDTLDAILSGNATATDHVILNDTLRCDPEARRTYIRTMMFEGMLACEFAPLENPASIEPSSIRPRRWWIPASVAATIALASILAWKLPQRSDASQVADSSIDDDQITHAVITSLEDASGRFGDHLLSTGMRLSGGMLKLDRGLASITFDTGAEVTLQGPASFLLESQAKSRLDSGRASAYVPEQARGFVIHTPTSYVRDLGTAFSLEVRDDRDTDLHVIEGEVEVAATGRTAVREPRILRQNEAVRLSRGSMVPIRFRDDKPSKPSRSLPKIPPSVHWAFDSWDADFTTDSTRGHLLQLQKHDRNTLPELLEGPFGKAIHFDGDGTYAHSTYPGVGGSHARTVACWLCIPPGEGNREVTPNGIIAWGVDRSSAKWQLAWNQNKTQGNIGAPRVEFGDGSVVGSTDLRDGRWHHLAVVFLGGPRANVATHVRIYVDGKLETLTGRRQQRINTDTRSADAQPLTIGRYLGNRPGKGPFYFEGDLDELHVFEGPLLPSQIVRLMKRNHLRPIKN